MARAAWRVGGWAMLLCGLACVTPKPRVLVDGACDSDRDCAYGLVCKGAPPYQPGPRACVFEDFGACESAADCLSGHVCRSNRCTVECVSDGECRTGRHCIIGECRLIDEERACRTSSDCAVDEECVSNTCRPALRMRCFRDMDCAGGERCLEGRCR